MLFLFTNGFVLTSQCPTCNTISGILQGDMPILGSSMTYKVIPKGLPGYDDYHSIQITYNVQVFTC
jgi:hypothetical protein